MIELSNISEFESPVDSLKRIKYQTLPIAQNTSAPEPHGFLPNCYSALVEEIPVAISINDISHAVMMVTPCALEQFALGFAFSEYLIESVNDVRDIEIEQITQDYGNSLALNLTLSPKCFYQFKVVRKTRLGATGCGLCGVESLEHAFPSLPILPVCDVISPELLPPLRQRLSDLQTLGRESGAIHAALLLSASGEILVCMEDIGRHNALDKVLGFALSQQIDLHQHSVVLSSRCSTELVQKAVRAKLSRLIHLASPSNMAVMMARQSGLHLIHLPKQDVPRQYSPVSLTENDLHE